MSLNISRAEMNSIKVCVTHTLTRMINITPSCFWTYITIVAVLLLAMHFVLGVWLKLYDKIKMFDTIIHFLAGGFFFTVIGFWLSYKYMDLTLIMAAIFAFSFAVTIGTLWEIFEFTLDSIFHTNMQRWKDFSRSPRSAGLIDTMGDTIANCLGSLFVSVLILLVVSVLKIHFV